MGVLVGEDPANVSEVRGLEEMRRELLEPEAEGAYTLCANAGIKVTIPVYKDAKL